MRPSNRPLLSSPDDASRHRRQCAAPRASRRTVAVRAQAVSRREALSATVAGLALLMGTAAPARAGFFDGGEGDREEYTTSTSALVALAKEAVTLDKNDPNKESKVAELRTALNVWVAKYRRDDRFAGRPSYGNTYSAMNALAGHFNSFGNTTPVPKKRLERVLQASGDCRLLPVSLLLPGAHRFCACLCRAGAGPGPPAAGARALNLANIAPT